MEVIYGVLAILAALGFLATIIGLISRHLWFAGVKSVLAGGSSSTMV